MIEYNKKGEGQASQIWSQLEQTPRAETAWLGCENFWKGALVRLGWDFMGAAWVDLLVLET
jgi:hypothetical protein